MIKRASEEIQHICVHKTLSSRRANGGDHFAVFALSIEDGNQSTVNRDCWFASDEPPVLAFSLTQSSHLLVECRKQLAQVDVPPAQLKGALQDQSRLVPPTQFVKR